MPKKLFLIIGALIALLIPSIYLGTLPPSPLYFLKVSRESVQSLFIFGDEDRANWILTLADKRLNEAQKLRLKKLNYFSAFQINTALKYQNEAQGLLEILKNKTNIIYLRDKYNQNDEKLKNLGAQ